MLNEMCGQLEYECVAEGVIPNVIFKMTGRWIVVIVCGRGRSMYLMLSSR